MKDGTRFRGTVTPNVVEWSGDHLPSQWIFAAFGVLKLGPFKHTQSEKAHLRYGTSMSRFVTSPMRGVG